MTTIISFVSQKGGVGKTTTAVNLAACFSIGEFKTLLIDLDPQGSVRFSIDIKQDVAYGTKELFMHPEISNDKLICKTDLHENLDFIFSNIDSLSDERDINRRAIAYDHLHTCMVDRIKDYDVVIIDAPASTNNIALNAIFAADLIILPIQCENLAVRSMKRFLFTFQEFQQKVKERELKIAGILLTMFDKNIEIHRKIARQLYNALSDSIFQTIIPRHESIVNSSAEGQSVIVHKLNSVGAVAYIHFMNELIERHKNIFLNAHK